MLLDLTSYQTVTIIRSNRKITYNVIRQTQRRSAYFPDVDFKCCFFTETKKLGEVSR